MAEGKKMLLADATIITKEILVSIIPHCVKIKVAGSIRRQKPEIADIELVCIPKPYQSGLFEDGLAAVVNQWQKVKGDMVYGVCKYTQRLLPHGIKLDMFFAEENNFGNILLIRTGDFEFSKKFVGVLLPRNGYKQEGGFLKHKDKIIPCPEEADMFQRAGINYIEPKNRNANAIR